MGYIVQIDPLDDGSIKVIINGCEYIKTTSPKSGKDFERAYDAGATLPLYHIEKIATLRALEECGWNINKAAERLVIGQATIYRKLRAWKISPREKIKEKKKRLEDITRQLVAAAKLQETTVDISPTEAVDATTINC